MNALHEVITSIKPRLAIAGFGLAAGLISSLAISALILLSEKVSSIPVGTFYLVLMSAILQSQDDTFYMIVSGFLLHLVAGSIMGLFISIPFVIRWTTKYAPVYGLAAGFAIWSLLFLPITYGMVLPLLNSLNQTDVIRQQALTGEVVLIETSELLLMMDKILIVSLAFNMFYGLLVAIIIKPMSEKLYKPFH